MFRYTLECSKLLVKIKAAYKQLNDEKYPSVEEFVRKCKVIRPPDILVGGFKFYRDSSFLILFSPATLRFAEWNSTKTGHMLGSECNLKMHV